MSGGLFGLTTLADLTANAALGAAPGRNGMDGTGVFDAFQTAGSKSFTLILSNGLKREIFIPPGSPGLNGITPTFTQGTIQSVAYGGQGSFALVPTATPGLYSYNVTLVMGPAPWALPLAYAAGIAATPIAPATQVVYGKSTYVCTTAHTTTATFDASKWICVAQGGADGNGNVNGTASTLDAEIMVADGAGTRNIKGSGKRLTDLGGVEAVVPVTGARTLAASDAFKLLLCSGGPYAITGSPSTFGAGLWVDIKNTLPGILTFTPSSGTVDGLASIKIYGETFRLISDGTNFYTANRQRRVLAGLTTIGSAAASVVYTGLGEAEVGDFELEYNGLTTSANSSVVMTVSQGGTFLNSGYSTAGNQATTSGGSANVTTGVAAFNLQPNGQVTAGAPSSGLFRLGGFRLGAPGLSLFGLSNTPVTTGNSYGYSIYGWSTVASTAPIDGVSIAPSSGNFTAGTVKLWALRG